MKGQRTRQPTESQKEFAAEVLRGTPAVKAYLHAYPNCGSYSAAASNANKLLKQPHILALLTDYRAKVVAAEGDRVMSMGEKRALLAEIARGKSDNTAARIAAIKTDNDLAGDGSEAVGNDALGALLDRITAPKES